jgi:hypothetical protein
MSASLSHGAAVDSVIRLGPGFRRAVVNVNSLGAQCTVTGAFVRYTNRGKEVKVKVFVILEQATKP